MMMFRKVIYTLAILVMVLLAMCVVAAIFLGLFVLGLPTWVYVTICLILLTIPIYREVSEYLDRKTND